jgi:hypothetical protein
LEGYSLEASEFGNFVRKLFSQNWKHSAQKYFTAKT